MVGHAYRGWGWVLWDGRCGVGLELPCLLGVCGGWVEGQGLLLQSGGSWAWAGQAVWWCVCVGLPENVKVLPLSPQVTPSRAR